MSAGQQAAAGTAAGNPVNLTDHSISDSAAGATAFAQFSTASNGKASYATLNSGTGDYTDEWTRPTSGSYGSAYEIRATLNSGSLDGGSSATGSWLALSSTRAWSVTRSTVGNTSANLTIEIRLNSAAYSIVSKTVTLSATKS